MKQSVINSTITSPFLTHFRDDNYSKFLDRFSIQYVLQGNYLMAGELLTTQGWILHISVIRSQLNQLFNVILPFLKSENAIFKIIKDYKTAKQILDGDEGYAQIGKIICIYPRNDIEAIGLAKKIIPIIKDLRGPIIPTDIQLNGPLFTRLGCYKPIMNTKTGIEGKFLYTNLIGFVEDVYRIPFIIPDGFSWPFSEIRTPTTPVMKKLLNNSYKLISLIKPDPKGRVFKGLYFKGILNIKKCLVKEGKNNMWSDDLGRDIQDRLTWQKEVYKDLSSTVLLPTIFDLFKENDDLYLVMEYITGKSLEVIISTIYKNNAWLNLLLSERIKLINYLLQITSVIEKMHEKGYIHRDISPANFIIDKNDQIFLIDLELCYSLNLSKPTPPFQLGTPGFISPQQKAALTPTISEDIYGLGALMIVFLTNLAPAKFATASPTSLVNRINFFCKSTIISQLIKDCLFQEKADPPTIQKIKEQLQLYRNQLLADKSQKNPFEQFEKPEKTKIASLINLSLNCLSNSLMINSDNLWQSHEQNNDTHILTTRSKKKSFPSFHTGIAGVLYLIAKAKKNGFEVDSSLELFSNNYKYLEKNYLLQLSKQSPGLYDGSAGYALALHQGMISGILNFEQNNLELLKECFENMSSNLDIASGIAGQGISLQQCAEILEKEFVTPLLNKYIIQILSQQKKDGSWKTDTINRNHGGISTGLTNGMSGVIYFLLQHLAREENCQVKEAIERGLNYLLSKSKKQKENYSWQISTNNKITDMWSYCYGVPGIGLLFLKAYKYFQYPLYKKVAEGCLRNIISTPVVNDFSQAYGISGLGEIYVEANQILGSDEWQNRAEWLVSLLINTLSKNEDGSIYWSYDGINDPTSDLMVGNSGIIHFLMRFLMPEKVSAIL